MAQACNPSYLGGSNQEDQCSVVAKIVKDTISTNIWTQWYMPFIPSMWGCTDRSVMVQPCPGIKQDPISKIALTQK
jgi:hypothetical protein